MSNFYATVTCSSSKTKATKAGSKDLAVHIGGWDVGVRVECEQLDPMTQHYRIFKTGGSNYPSDKQIIHDFYVEV